ncbi:MAG: thioredoxin [Acidobacteriota bacterium]|nr:thioredoxin [Acidobacteriota bacterium]MDH3786305.1 thioredoxin [Acidobacteriota bacterium]
MSQVVELNDSNFDNEVMQADQPVLVDFSATWCGPCKKLEPIVDELAGDYEGRVKIGKVDVDKAPNTAAKFGVMSVPTLILFQGGQVKDQMVGLHSKQSLSDKVDRVL